MNSWIADIKSTGMTSNSYSGVLAAVPIHKNPYGVTAGGATQGLRVDINATAVTVVGSITITLQQSSDNSNWENTKTATISAAGIFSIKFLPTVAGDQTYMPLKNLIRLVLTTTNAGDAVTISEIRLSQEK